MATTQDRLRNIIQQDRTGDQINGLKLDIGFELGPVQTVKIIGGELIVAQHNAEETSKNEGLFYDSIRLKPNQKKALISRGVVVKN